MNTSWRGFTIVETMLVLAITGFVATIILASIGVGLRNEQYHSAVDQIFDYFQGQYSLAAAIQNDRSAADGCPGVDTPGGVSVDRGTSNCFVLGRIVKTSNGQIIKSYPVIAWDDVLTKPGVESMLPKKVFSEARLYQGASESQYDTANESGVRLTYANGVKSAFTVLIMRSPTTGRIHTYIRTSEQGDGGIGMDDFNEAPLKLCVDPNGLINTGISPSAILIEKGAANASAVQLLGSGGCA